MDLDPPRRIDRSALTQWWGDVTFLHWRVPPGAVDHLLPAGTRPDVVDGDTFVGLVAFRLSPLGWPALTGRWSFPETNVRLYTVDTTGRRGVVFLSMDAADLTFVAGTRASVGLPYMWSDMAVRRDGDELTYTCRRRWPRRPGATSSLTVRPGERIEPSPLDEFLTARWGLHTSWFGRTAYLPNHHAPWVLHRATVVRCDDNLVASAGIEVTGEPFSVLYSPGVQARFGVPARVRATEPA
ncbi:YqjF family protein [Lentzea sp. NPDC059081]|uniref:YqjF family protein n=1 Tax=Lentzea sp. NPDC059081 TaxID=3346719 RepID=UPI0036D12D63